MVFIRLRALFFPKNDENRSEKAKRNIAVSTIFRGVNLVIAYLMVPLAINYLSPTKYGIFITLTSVVGWLTFFDVGLGHGLRNKLAESLATEDVSLSKKYVSTTYVFVTGIAIILFLVFIVLNQFISWRDFLNISDFEINDTELRRVAVLLMFFFSFNFALQLINSIILAKQEPFIITITEMGGKIFSLITLVILIQYSTQDLFLMCLSFSGSTALSLLVTTIYLFRKDNYRSIRPNIKMIDFSISKNIMNLGVKFFVIRVSAVLLYSTNNIIISQLFGPNEVTPYNVALTYFNPLLLIFSIVLSPFWSAFTDAWTKKDIPWVKTAIKKLILLWIGLIFVAIVLVVIAKPVYSIWVGTKVQIDYSLFIGLAILMLVNSWNSIFSNFLNGVGKVKLQVYLSVIAAVINIPLTVFIGKELGLFGIVLANIMVASLGMIIYPFQYSRIISNKSSGIWTS